MVMQKISRFEPKPTHHYWLPLIPVMLIVLVSSVVLYHMTSTPAVKTAGTVATTKKAALTSSTPIQSVAATSTSSVCAGVSGKTVIVSISSRHMWACDGTTQAYDSAVVTGMENLPADLTPTGTYHIYAKETDLYLNGSDSTGSWHDYVNNWMPFLHNQYGSYGFHDATWRAATDFGNISPYSSNASHGCVELPLATATWLYSWVAIGTTVTINA
jgi:lipoprotein-anchoring transpeptidase ErfK/SrfK